MVIYNLVEIVHGSDTCYIPEAIVTSYTDLSKAKADYEDFLEQYKKAYGEENDGVDEDVDSLSYTKNKVIAGFVYIDAIEDMRYEFRLEKVIA